MNPTVLYIAAGITGLWGVAHLFATKGAVAEFGDISADNRRLITMEWISEGVALIAIAAFVATTTAIDLGSAVASGVFGVAIGTLLVLAIVSLLTGFRVAFWAYRLCPLIFSVSAALIAWGAWL